MRRFVRYLICTAVVLLFIVAGLCVCILNSAKAPLIELRNSSSVYVFGYFEDPVSGDLLEVKAVVTNRSDIVEISNLLRDNWNPASLKWDGQRHGRPATHYSFHVVSISHQPDRQLFLNIVNGLHVHQNSFLSWNSRNDLSRGIGKIAIPLGSKILLRATPAEE